MALALGQAPAARRAVALPICAVIVTYRPDGGFHQRLTAITRQVAAVLVVDNGSPEATAAMLRSLADDGDAHVLHNASNLGVAAALNIGVAWARARGYRWVLTLDQDSVLDPTLTQELTSIAQCSAAEHRVAVVGANYRNQVDGRAEYPSAKDNARWLDVPYAITSGSLLSVAAFEHIGGFREDFFIDYVDIEYCFRARALGYTTVVSSEPLMEHSIGSVVIHPFLWRRVIATNHAPLRRYYMARNAVATIKLHGRRYPRWVCSQAVYWGRIILTIVLFEHHRGRKLRAIAVGLLDGLRGRMGERRSP